MISLTPGFSPVTDDREDWNRFNGFAHNDKPLKRLGSLNFCHPAKAGC
jgi:hypothetical protein